MLKTFKILAEAWTASEVCTPRLVRMSVGCDELDRHILKKLPNSLILQYLAHSKNLTYR